MDLDKAAEAAALLLSDRLASVHDSLQMARYQVAQRRAPDLGLVQRDLAEATGAAANWEHWRRAADQAAGRLTPYAAELPR